MVRSHSCTVGTFRLGSKAAVVRAEFSGAVGARKKPLGFCVGEGIVSGKPPDIVLVKPDGVLHPDVIVELTVELELVLLNCRAQFRTAPTTFPDTAVIWKVEMVSNA